MFFFWDWVSFFFLILKCPFFYETVLMPDNILLLYLIYLLGNMRHFISSLIFKIIFISQWNPKCWTFYLRYLDLFAPLLLENIYFQQGVVGLETWALSIELNEMINGGEKKKEEAAWASESDLRPGFAPCLCHFPPVWPWAGHLSPLLTHKVSFLVFEIVERLFELKDLKALYMLLKSLPSPSPFLIL
jgi:hypothetical protein